MKRLCRRIWGVVAGLPPSTRAVAIALVVAHAVQCVVAAAPIRTIYVGGDGTGWLLVPDVLTFLFAISGSGLSMGFFWTPLTYVFLHGGVLHLLLNLGGLVVFGSALERVVGAKAFWTAFLLSGIVGGAGWALAQGLSSMQPCVGASAAVLGLAGAFAVLRPREKFVIIFPLPCVLPAWALVSAMFVLSAAELGAVGTHVAYLAHLVGIVVGAGVGAAGRRVTRSKIGIRNIAAIAESDEEFPLQEQGGAFSAPITESKQK